jgi:hypothetical protein
MRYMSELDTIGENIHYEMQELLTKVGKEI